MTYILVFALAAAMFELFGLTSMAKAFGMAALVSIMIWVMATLILPIVIVTFVMVVVGGVFLLRR